MELDLVSVSSLGVPGNAPSQDPSISSDGRFVAFTSQASNLVQIDANNAADVFLHDRQTGSTSLLSILPTGEQGLGPSTQPAISGNGRMVAFQSSAFNLAEGASKRFAGILVFDRLTGLLRLASPGRGGQAADGDSASPAIDDAGRYLAFQSAAANLVFSDTNGLQDIFIYDLVTGNMLRIGPGRDPAISGDGRFVAFVNAEGGISVYHRVLGTLEQIAPAAEAPQLSATGRFVLYSVGGQLHLFDRDEAVDRTLPVSPSGPAAAFSTDASSVLFATDSGFTWQAVAGGSPISIAVAGAGAVLDLSADGRVLAFSGSGAGALNPHSQVFVQELNPQPDSFHLAGRVTDARGRPLGLVTIADGLGGSTRTDLDGYFYLSGYPAGPLTLTPEKEGYTFEPLAWNLSVFRDVSGYLFTASAEETLLEEARLDLGMPYDFDRGCDSPHEGCGKPFHGFAAGFCTDLILDAYTFGLEYDISYALEQDAYAHPEHFYRWRDARNAHDMWRFFHYSGQMLPHEEPYLPGDIVFFDWSGDGEIDHVALVSEVSGTRPVMLIDATGVTEQNPSGLAAELEWLPFHTDTVRGHARWDGTYEPVSSGYPPDAHLLQTALSGGGVFMRILDSAGRAVSFGESALSGAQYFDLDWEEVISLRDPGGVYTVEIHAVRPHPVPYIFTLQTLSDGWITGRVIFSGLATAEEPVRYTWEVGEDGAGNLKLLVENAPPKGRLAPAKLQ